MKNRKCGWVESKTELDGVSCLVLKAIGGLVAAVVWASAGLVVTAIALGLM